MKNYQRYMIEGKKESSEVWHPLVVVLNRPLRNILACLAQSNARCIFRVKAVSKQQVLDRPSHVRIQTYNTKKPF